MSGWIGRMFGRRPSAQAGAAQAGMSASAAQARATASAAQPPEPAFDELFARADGLARAGQFAQAQAALEAALAIRHDSARAHYTLGCLLMKTGRVEDALDSFVLATCFAPDMAEAYHALAEAERRLGEPARALGTVERALALGASASALNLRGALLLERGDVAGAIGSFEQALGLEPDNATAHSNLGFLLFRDRGEHARGARHIERALEIDPGNGDARCNLTMVQLQRGEYLEVIAACDRILAADPDEHEARLNRALALLHLGRFERAWDDYEARKRVRCNYVPRAFPCREWDGEDLRGRTIAVYGEQGLGDEIMFASCFQDLIERCGRCVIECAPALETLFRRSFPAASVVAGKQSQSEPEWWRRAAPIEFHVAAGSLPRHFRRGSDRFPARKRYLAPDETRARYWAERLAELGPGPKVGISWRGGTPSTGGALRSTDLSDWLPVLQTAQARFVNLQYGDTAAECGRLVDCHGVRLAEFRAALADLDELAALVASLDLVISVPTTVIHLAGALGSEVWVLVPYRPEWRYRSSGETMAWYPGARLIRQRAADEWTTALAEAAARLSERAAWPGGG